MILNKVAIVASMLALTAVAHADPIGGEKRGWGYVGVGQGDSYRVLIDTRTTIFEMTGDGDGDIDCYAFDGNGNEVAHDIRRYDGCRLVVSPNEVSMYRFVFINNGGDISEFRSHIY
jgi:hypothetical protein